mmetsp:Transcript_1765/g.6958  ORF Transcript_1765/g.6958 Transcript_1765/m.6958 type:complete len:212 (-) Transcript_1765:2289-2924(-)
MTCSWRLRSATTSSLKSRLWTHNAWSRIAWVVSRSRTSRPASRAAMGRQSLKSMACTSPVSLAFGAEIHAPTRMRVFVRHSIMCCMGRVLPSTHSKQGRTTWKRRVRMASRFKSGRGSRRSPRRPWSSRRRRRPCLGGGHRTRRWSSQSASGCSRPAARLSGTRRSALPAGTADKARRTSPNWIFMANLVSGVAAATARPQTKPSVRPSTT